MIEFEDGEPASVAITIAAGTTGAAVRQEPWLSMVDAELHAAILESALDVLTEALKEVQDEIAARPGPRVVPFGRKGQEDTQT